MEWFHYMFIGFGFLILLYIGLSYKFYLKLLVKFKRKNTQLVDHETEFYQESYKWFQSIPKEDVYIRSYDNLKLHSYYIPSLDKNSNNLAIVIHGYQSKATDMIIIGKLYSDLGFKVLMIDLRAHGYSEGKFTSIGHYEKYDLKKWINFALRSYGADNKVLLHGVSMGAAMSILVTELKIKKNVKFLVLDSSFTKFIESLRNIVKPKVLRVFFLGISMFTYLLHHFTLYQIKPINVIKKIEIPFMIIHSKEDTLVPVKMANDLYVSGNVARKDLLIIDNAPHAKAFEINKSRVMDRIVFNISDIFGVKKTYIKKIE